MINGTPRGRGGGQRQDWRNRRARPVPAVRPDHDDPTEERRPRPPAMFRSRVQLATTYAPGVLFTWEGAKGICRSVPIDRGEAAVSDATRLLVFDGMKEIASTWFDRASTLRAPDNVFIELILDDVFYDRQSQIVDRDGARVFQLCDPSTMGYVPYPLVYRCGVCGHLREYESIADQARHPLPARCGDHEARWSQVDVVYVHWSGHLEPLSPFRNNYDQNRGRVVRLTPCTCGGRDFRLNNQAPVFSDWSFVCESCKKPRDLKQPDPLTLELLERDRQNGGRTFERIEVNMLPVSYRANSAFYPQKGTFIEFRDRRVVDLLLTHRQGEMLQRLAEIHRIPFASPSDQEIRTALAAAQREAEWDDYADHREMAERAAARGQTDRADKLQRDSQTIREAWFASGVIDRGRVQSPALAAAVVQRAEWARRYDPIRLTIEHDRFCAEHIHERRAQHESIDVMEPDRLICDAVGDPVRMARYSATTGALLGHLGVEQIVLIRRRVPMPVRLNRSQNFRMEGDRSTSPNKGTRRSILNSMKGV